MTTTHAFDLLSREVAVTGGGSENASTNLYNALGQILVATDSDGIVSETVYDAAGRTTATSVAGKTTTMTYDSTGRTVQTVDPDSKRLHYTHDPFGRVAAEIHTTQAGVVRHTEATTDSLGRTLSTADVQTGVQRAFDYPTAPGEGTSVAVSYAGITTTVTADAAGRELSRASQLPSGALVRTVGPRDSAERETGWTVGALSFARTLRSADGKLTGLSIGADTLSYTYDASARKASAGGTLPLAGSLAATYAYTATGRLATDTVSGAAATYEFDAGGNLATETVGALTTVYTYGAGNRLQQSARVGQATTYGWNTAQGWRTSARASGEASVTFDYTGTGRLASYTDPNRAVTATYEYDAAGQRTRSVVTSGPVTTETRFTYEGLSLLSLAATETAGSSVSTYSVTYLYDASASPYAGLYASAEATAVPFTTVATDRGDIVELRDVSGAPFAAYRYDAWGSPLSVTSADTSSLDAVTAAAIAARQPLRYAGYCWDEHSGCYYLSARTYDPATRQFLTKDPAKADGEESAYQYCCGDPVNTTDATGMAWSRILPVPQYVTSEVCWTGALWAVFKYLGKGSISQGAMLAALWRYWPRKSYALEKSATLAEIQVIMKYFGVSSTRKDTGPLWWWDVEREIDAGRPIIAYMHAPSLAHVVVIRGYSRTGFTIYYLDPADGLWHARGARQFYNLEKKFPFKFSNGQSFNWSWARALYNIHRG